MPDPPVERPLLVGFQDDVSFRWRADRQALLDEAVAAGATVVRTTIEWARVAPTAPAKPGDPFDPALRLDDVDELVRNAQARGVEVMFTIWGTPGWANGGAGENRLPTRLADLTAFARAVASRYSGRHAGFPFVRYFSVWNEPNLEQFLAPQFDRRGRSLSPSLYARLYRAAAAGIAAGNPDALLAAGETSARGRDHPSDGRVQESHSPGRFAQLLARVRPRVRFDAWAHHPYPTAPHLPPTQHARWPNVTLLGLPRFGRALDRWFGRPVPLWLTEYAHETTPHEPRGVSPRRQAEYAARALQLAAADPRVRMFVWFTFRDDRSNPWQSGLLARAGGRKPAFARFATAARPLDARGSIDRAEGGRSAVVRASALELAYHSGPRAPVQVSAKIAGRRVSGVEPTVPGRDGWLTVRVPLPSGAPARAVLELDLRDAHGNQVTIKVSLDE